MKIGLAVSGLMHLAVVYVLLYQAPPPLDQADLQRQVVRLFMPNEEAAANKSPEKARSSASLSADREIPKLNQKKLDLSAIELTIRDDMSREMLVVLKRYGGWVVLLDPANRSMEAAYQAPNWRRVAGASLATGLPVLLGQPEWWPEVETLARQGSEDAIVCALFPAAFADAMSEAIQRKAMGMGITEIHRVVFVFSARDLPGFVVEDVA